jgi:hypothetical protein
MANGFEKNEQGELVPILTDDPWTEQDNDALEAEIDAKMAGTVRAKTGPKVKTDKATEGVMSAEEMTALMDDFFASVPAPKRKNAARTRRRRPRYALSGISSFDARRGYARCNPPGVGVSDERQGALADFWRDRTGRVVVRFSSRGYIYHMEAVLVSGKDIRERQMDDFSDWVADVLLQWMIEGVGEVPEPRS